MEVVGSGRLADAVRSALTPVADLAKPGNRLASARPDRLLLAVSDGWQRDYAPVRVAAAADRAGWLPVRTELGYAVIGPTEVAGRPGCVDCAEARRQRIHPDRHCRAAVWQQHGQELADRPSAWLTGLSADLIGALVTDEVQRLAGGGPPRTRQALLRVALASLAVTRHRFLPDPVCPTCGALPDDSPEQARIRLTSRPVHAPGSYRFRPVDEVGPQLLETYVDQEAGLIRSLDSWTDAGMMVTGAPVGLRPPATDREAGYGRTGRLSSSRLTALLEGLERYASAPSARRTAVTASYQELGDRALDPRTLGLHPAHHYQLPGFRYRRFGPDRPYRWVWGWSFTRAEPILVPECYAYYNAHQHDQVGPPFAYEVSNGCALGGCLEEAILYGILEVAERDAFLLTWYARLPAARIDLSGFDDREPALLAATIRAATGYRVVLFDITMEQGIPGVWATATNPDPDDGRPALVCAAGAHPDPRQAVRSALRELGPITSFQLQRYPAAAERARRMAADPDQVVRMDDHSLLYGDPEAARRLDFLLDGGMVRPLREVGRAERGGFASDDLRDHVQEAVGRYVASQLDVIVVDQTAAEHRAGGLRCVKVIIPGALPMTFGHRYRRVDGLPRLQHIPWRLGYRDRPLPLSQINPHPHPFP